MRLSTSILVLSAIVTIYSAPAAARNSVAPIAAEVVRNFALTDLGRAPGATPVTIAVMLPYRHADELDGLAEAQSDARSPLYGQFLSNRQFNDYFAPSPQAYVSVINELRHAGFTITGVYDDRLLVDATAPAAVAERYFGTEIHRVGQAGFGIRYANSRPAYMPPGLRGVALSVSGLNNLIVARPQLKFRGAAAAPNVIGGPLRGPDTGFGPEAFANGYNMPVQSGFSGTGHAAANEISGDFLNSDLKTFRLEFGITRTGTITRVAVDGGAGFGVTPDSEESTLDIETIAMLAPGANVYVYLFPDLSDVHIEDGYNRAVSDGFADVVNSSFGGCETADTPFAHATDTIAQGAQVKGMTFAASSGDSGSNECGGGNSVSEPASGPHFVAVGGTHLKVTSTGAYVSETAWSGSGGGISVIFARPAYQTLVSGTSSTGRNVPDISFDADPSTGAAWFFDGGWFGPIGGTSLSSPIFTAMQTEINQQRGKRFGKVDKHIYTAAAAHPADFHDITSGSNGGFSAHAGYDKVTGIGSENGELLQAVF